MLFLCGSMAAGAFEADKQKAQAHACAFCFDQPLSSCISV
jgi:hypothetical protein